MTPSQCTGNLFPASCSMRFPKLDACCLCDCPSAMRGPLDDVSPVDRACNLQAAEAPAAVADEVAPAQAQPSAEAINAAALTEEERRKLRSQRCAFLGTFRGGRGGGVGVTQLLKAMRK